MSMLEAETIRASPRIQEGALARCYRVPRRLMTHVGRLVKQLASANKILLRELWAAMPVVTVARIAAGVTMVACPFATWWGSGMLIEALADSKPLTTAIAGLVAMFISLVLMGILPTLLSSLDKIGENWVFRHVQSAIAAKAVALDQMTLTNPAFAARFKQVKDRAVWRMMSMMRSQPMLLRTLGSVIVTLVILALHYPYLALLIVVFFLPCVGIEARHAQRQSKVDEELAPLWGSLWGDLYSLTTSISIAMLQVFGAGGWFARRYRSGIETAASRENHLERRAILVRISAAALGGMALVAMSVWLILEVSAGELALSKLVLLLGAASSLGLSLAESASLIGQQFNQAYYVNALEDLLNTKSAVSFPEQGVAVEGSSTEGVALAFEQVSYRYPGEGQSKFALEAVDLAITAGWKVALVGPNGAGKSTAMSLITRQVDPTLGTVRIGGAALTMLEEATLRQLIIQLPQSLRHYNLSVRELLNLGRPNSPATESELKAALARTGADRFIAKWTEGLDTRLGNDRPLSVEPSGGQLQRLLLTAVLLASSRLIILDEPVSMVDPEAAKQFWDAVFKEMPGKTVLFSTHHLGAVRRADQILFIDEGRLVASGHHDALMQECPRYRTLFESQASDYR